MTEIRTGFATTSTIRYVQEEEGASWTGAVTDVEVAARDWDVTDPEARYEAAVKELGSLPDDHRDRVMWFIDEARNAAALCVFRPWQEQATHGQG